MSAISAWSDMPALKGCPVGVPQLVRCYSQWLAGASGERSGGHGLIEAGTEPER